MSIKFQNSETEKIFSVSNMEEANISKPRICEVLRVEVNQSFQFNDFPFDEVKSYLIGPDGKIRNVHGGEVTSSELCYIINNSDCIIHMPHWTEQEVEDAKYIKRIMEVDMVRRNEYGSGLVAIRSDVNVSIVINRKLFPSLCPGEVVALDKIIEGAE